MNLPQVNANVTDVEREKTDKVMQLLSKNHMSYCRHLAKDKRFYCVPTAHTKEGKEITIYAAVDLPNGSLTLDQCVGMLEELGCVWTYPYFMEDGEAFEGGWCAPTGKKGEVETIFEGYKEPQDLSSALDALIKVLEIPDEQEVQ